MKKLYIGLKDGCVLKEAPEYAVKKPVVYYGSSITQGGCASKPGSSYESILSRRLDCDYLNLGFSGKALGEDEMADYIKGLEKTHNKIFKAIRAAQPKLPIIIMPRPKFYLTEVEKIRYEIIHNTYLEAKEAGDENVYFISGRKLMEIVEDNGSVDGYHPTDSGFFSMACAVEEVLREIIRGL